MEPRRGPSLRRTASALDRFTEHLREKLEGLVGRAYILGSQARELLAEQQALLDEQRRILTELHDAGVDELARGEIEEEASFLLRQVDAVKIHVDVARDAAQVEALQQANRRLSQVRARVRDAYSRFRSGELSAAESLATACRVTKEHYGATLPDFEGAVDARYSGTVMGCAMADRKTLRQKWAALDAAADVAASVLDGIVPAQHGPIAALFVEDENAHASAARTGTDSASVPATNPAPAPAPAAAAAASGAAEAGDDDGASSSTDEPDEDQAADNRYHEDHSSHSRSMPYASSSQPVPVARPSTSYAFVPQHSDSPQNAEMEKLRELRAREIKRKQEEARRMDIARQQQAAASKRAAMRAEEARRRRHAEYDAAQAQAAAEQQRREQQALRDDAIRRELHRQQVARHANETRRAQRAHAAHEAERVRQAAAAADAEHFASRRAVEAERLRRSRGRVGSRLPTEDFHRRDIHRGQPARQEEECKSH